MQARTVLIWIVVAGILGAIVVLSERPTILENNSIKDSWRSLGIDPARVVQLTRVLPDQTDQGIERSGGGGQDWSVLWEHAGKTQAWDADARRVRAGLRSLGTQQIAESESDTLDELSGSIRVMDSEGKEIQIDFGTTAIGGFVPIRVDERDGTGIVQSRWYGRIERGVRDAFITTGFLPWRANSVFTGAPSQIDAVSLEAGMHGVSLIRGTNGWSISEPFMSDADDGKVNEMIGSLLALESTGFVDDADTMIMDSFESPIARITMTQGDHPVTLRVGSQADIGGSEVFALVESADRTAVIRIPKEQLAKLTPTPEGYIGRIPVAAAGSDITEIQILGDDKKARLIAQRQMGKWTISDKAATSEYEQTLNRLVRVLTSEPAAGTRFIGINETPPEMLGSIIGLDSDGQPIADLRFGLDSSEDGLRLLIAQPIGLGEQILWICTSDEAGGTGAWLTAMVSRRAP